MSYVIFLKFRHEIGYDKVRPSMRSYDWESRVGEKMRLAIVLVRCIGPGIEVSLGQWNCHAILFRRQRKKYIFERGAVLAKVLGKIKMSMV